MHALTMSLVMGVVLLLVLRSADLNHPKQHTPLYAPRLGLGILQKSPSGDMLRAVCGP
jgi:hypothetical protein